MGKGNRRPSPRQDIDMDASPRQSASPRPFPGFVDKTKDYIKTIVTHRYFIHYCFALYIALRALLIFALPVEQGSDAAWYFSRAQGLADGFGFGENGMATAYWPIGWPAALAAVFWLFAPTLLAGQLFNLSLSCLSFFLVVGIANRTFASRATTGISVFLLAIYPNNIAYVQTLMSEVFATTLLLLGCYLYLRWEQQSFRRTISLLLTGTVFAMLTLTKPQFVAFPLILMLLSILFASDGSTRRRIAANAIVMYVVLFAVATPWTYRNYKVFGEFVFVSTNGGLNLLIGNSPYATGDYAGFTDAQFPSVKFSTANQFAANKEGSRLAIDWISKNPLDFARLMPLKVWRLWAPDGEIEWLYQRGLRTYDEHVTAFRSIRIINQLYYIALLLSGLIVCPYLHFKHGAGLSAAQLHGFVVVVFLSGVSMIIFGSSRFHFPAMPFIAIYCAHAIALWIGTPGSRHVGVWSAAATDRHGRIAERQPSSHAHAGEAQPPDPQPSASEDTDRDAQRAMTAGFLASGDKSSGRSHFDTLKST